MKWLEGFGARRFLDAFLANAHDAESTCVRCGEPIYLDLLEGCGVADWRTHGGDYGCGGNVLERDADGVAGVGGHTPRRDDDGGVDGSRVPEEPDDADGASAAPGDDDVTANDPAGPYYYGGKEVAANAKDLLAWMDKDGYWPSVWWISDHGNPHPMTRGDLERRAADVRGGL